MALRSEGFRGWKRQVVSRAFGKRVKWRRRVHIASPAELPRAGDIDRHIDGWLHGSIGSIDECYSQRERERERVCVCVRERERERERSEACQPPFALLLFKYAVHLQNFCKYLFSLSLSLSLSLCVCVCMCVFRGTYCVFVLRCVSRPVWVSLVLKLRQSDRAQRREKMAKYFGHRQRFVLIYVSCYLNNPHEPVS